MTSNEELLHYIFVVLSRSKYTMQRVDTPDGNCIFLEVAEVRLFFTREDVEALVLNGEKDWTFSAALLDNMRRVLEYGPEYIEKGGKNDGKNEG